MLSQLMRHFTGGPPNRPNLQFFVIIEFAQLSQSRHLLLSMVSFFT
jgi:hypothetical protein